MKYEMPQTFSFDDDMIGFVGVGWPSPDGIWVIASGSTELRDDARTVVLYRRGLLIWRIRLSADALDCCVADSGRSLLSLSTMDVSSLSYSLLVVEPSGRRIVEHKVASAVEILAISGSGDFIAWTGEREIDHYTSQPWKNREVMVAEVAPWNLCLVRPVRVSDPNALSFGDARQLRVKDSHDRIEGFTF